jgi:ZIP family zinc transporter/zinc and cadmium transporter
MPALLYKEDFGPSHAEKLLAIAGGSFIYIAASDLVPESHRSRGLPASIALCLGVLVAMAAGMFTHAH